MNISSQLRVRFCVLIIGLWIILPGLMEKGPSKLRAQELRLYRDRIEPNWFAGDSKFWYKLELPGNRREFWLVDPQQGMRQPAFDHEAVAAAWNLHDNSQVQPERLAIDSLEFSENDESVLLNLVNQGQLQWNPATQELTQIKPAPTAAVGKLFMPPVPSTDEGGTSELTVKNQLDGTIQVIWVDREGNEQVYSTTPQGESFQISTYRGHVWLIRREGGEAIGCFVAQGDETVIELTPTMADNVENNRPTDNARRRGNARTPNRRGGRAGMAGEMRSRSPNREWQAFVRDHNLWLSRAQESDAVDSNRERQFSQDATVDNSFRRDASRARLVSMRYDLTDFPDEMPNVIWSPDSQYVLAWQTTRVEENRVVYIESSPRDQLKPKTQEYPYARAGDPLPVSLPRLFRVEDGQEIELDQKWFPNPFELRFERWNEAWDKAYLVYNQRGHQRLSLLEIDLNTGAIRPVIEETSPTFIHYSTGGKFELHWLPEESILWASERSGWNHLYRYDVESGQVRNAVTEGEWNVKRIESIDREAGVVWFFAVGVIPGQDPYHEHLCRVGLDGSGFQVLTPGDGTHSVQWSPDREFFIDTFSRVDQPPIIELRRAVDGTLVCELEHAELVGGREISPKAKMPERFVAKGRDGVTDIWGIVHWPSDYDPERQYPVIENIYAGPHSHHVPKGFSARRGGQRRMADAGFVVVQIDGMGTAWRSKAFHDVCYQNLRDSGFPDRVAWIKALGEKYPQLDLSRVGIYGGSAGGQNAMAALIWHNDFYKVAVADCGCHDNRMDKIWWNEQWMGELGDGSHYIANSNMENAHLMEGNLMLVVGELDRNVDPATTAQVVGRLIQANKVFVYLPIIGAGHGACETPYGSRRRLEFFQQHLGVKPVDAE